MVERVSNHTRIIIDFIASMFSSVLVFFVARFFSLSGFESFVFGVVFFISWRLIAIWLRHEASLTSLEKSSREHASLRIRTREVMSHMLNIISNHDEIANEKIDKKGISDSFIVELYEKKIDSINYDLESINRYGTVKIATNIFRRYPHIIFNIPKNSTREDKPSFFYAITSCNEGIRWLYTSEGMAYLKNIHRKVKNDNIRRLFIREPNESEEISQICFQLHRNSEYPIKEIKRENIDDNFAGLSNITIENDFGIYGKNFVWERMPNTSAAVSKKGKIYVDPAIISEYTKAFIDVWDDKNISTDVQIAPEITTFCTGKTISDLHNAIEEWQYTHKKRTSPQPNAPTNYT